MMRIIYRLRRDERGAAIAVVLLVGTVMVMLSSIMVARGMRQLVNTNNDTNWDNALYAAEAGLDDGLHHLDLDFGFETGETIPTETLGTADEHDWAVAAADEAPAEDVVTMARGEYVIVRPDNSTVLFAVGFAPNRAATERRVRVLRVSVDGVPWLYETEHALLVGGDLEISGNTTVNDTTGNDAASVHANGGIASSGASFVVEGCTTSVLTTFAATAQCPPSPAPVEPVPVIDPVQIYPYAHYVLCDDELAYGGPANTLTPDPDLIPCNGNEIITVLVGGWSSRTQGGKVTWGNATGAALPGVYYVHNGNFDGKLGSGATPVEVTLIVANGQGANCQAPSTGSIQLGANTNIVRHSSLGAIGYDIALVAQGDVEFIGNATVGGAILAHEQIDYRGTAESWGAVVAVDACNTLGSPISKNTTSSTSGDSTINFAGPLKTPFTASTLRAEVVGWYEL